MAEKHVIAGYLFETNRGKQEWKSIDRDIIDEIKRGGYWPLTTMQRLEKALLYLYSLNLLIGKVFSGEDIPTPAAYAKPDEIYGCLDAMTELGWLANGRNQFHFKLTVAGLTHAEELLRTNINSTQAFVAMQFSADMMDALDKAIRPACDECGFTAHIVSEKEHNNAIVDEIFTEIRKSKFVIVDFTHRNNGAYFEAGYAQGLGREVIRCVNATWAKEWDEADPTHIDETGKILKSLHFDTAHYNTIFWTSFDDLKRQLIARIRATIPGALDEDRKIIPTK